MIQRLKKAKTVYLATQIVDMRKSINGLAAIVQGSFALDLYEGSAFVFISRSHDKIKVLQWDTDGFVLYYKRREKIPVAACDRSGIRHRTYHNLRSSAAFRRSCDGTVYPAQRLQPLLTLVEISILLRIFLLVFERKIW